MAVSTNASIAMQRQTRPAREADADAFPPKGVRSFIGHKPFNWRGDTFGRSPSSFLPFQGYYTSLFSSQNVCVRAYHPSASL